MSEETTTSFSDKNGKKLLMGMVEIPSDNTLDEDVEFIKNKMQISLNEDINRKQIENNVRSIIRKFFTHFPTKEQQIQLDKINSQVKNICTNETLETLVGKLGGDLTDFLSSVYKSQVGTSEDDYKINFSAAIYKSIINPRSPDLENIIVNIQKQNYKFKDMANDVDDMFARLRLASLGLVPDKGSFITKRINITHKNLSRRDPYMEIL